MPHQLFEDEYTFARQQILNAIRTNRRHWDKKLARMAISSRDRAEQRLIQTIRDLPLVLHADGFHDAGNTVLNNFRDAWIAAARGARTEADVILDLFGWHQGLPAMLREVAIKHASAAKLFRHCYRVQRVGAQTIWVVAQPRGYTQFTTDEIWAVRNMPLALHARLNNIVEFYDAAERTRLSSATARVRRWCDRGERSAGRALNGTAADRNRVLGWFGQANMANFLTDELCRELQRGFGRMRRRIEENRLIYVDLPAERRNDGTLAFVAPDERLRSIYIKRHFFETNQTRFNLSIYWAVTILHEISHRVLGTEDHHYDHDKIGVRASHHVGHAINNADSWAYFAADVSGHLNNGQVAWLRTG